ARRRRGDADPARMSAGQQSNADAGAAPSDAALVAALAHDRDSALGVLYDRHAGLVYGIACAMLTNRDDADDLTQEVFLALCSRGDYDPARGTVAAYL